MPKISVIVPVYNVANYIERCARSLFEQTLNDLEYIFIDDCTPDNSIEILQSVIEEYRLHFVETRKVVRIERMPTNSRQAAVRRHGIQLANGDFVIHCDSDDWVDEDLYEKMYDEAVRADADIVVCPIYDEYREGNSLRPISKMPSSSKEVVANWWKESIGMFCWNKLVRRTVYVNNKLEPYDGVNMWEDNGLMMRVFYYANRLSQIEGSAYHYNQSNINAMTSGYGRDSVNQMIKCATLLGDFFESKPDASTFYKTTLTLKYLAKLNLVTTRYDWLNEFYMLFPESNVAVTWIGLDAFSTKGKIRFLFVKNHLAWLFVFLFKCFEIINSVRRER